MNKKELMEIMIKHQEKPDIAVKKAIKSGILPVDAIVRYLESMVEFSIHKRIERGENPAEWECWAKKWLSGEDRTGNSADNAKKACITIGSWSSGSIAAAADDLGRTKYLLTEIKRWEKEEGHEIVTNRCTRKIIMWAVEVIEYLNFRYSESELKHQYSSIMLLIDELPEDEVL